MIKLESIAALGVIAMLSAGARADTIWSQPGGSGTEAGLFWISDNTLPQSFADRFTLAQSHSLTGATWWGLATADLSAFTNVEAFVITIFDSSGSVPGAAVYSTSIAAADVTASADAPSDIAAGFRYEVDLAGLDLDAGDYYFSVVADALVESPESPTWAWQGLEYAMGVDGAAFKKTAGWLSTTDTDDMAFELHGTIQTVPLPMPVLLGGVGLLGVIPLRRRMMRGGS